MTEKTTPNPEPWLRGTFTEVPPVARAVLHALQLAQEDLHKWCDSLSEAQFHARPAGLPSVAFQLRHIAGSIDRLLTYAEGNSLSEHQLEKLKQEAESSGTLPETLSDLDSAISAACLRIRALELANLSLPRAVGKNKLPTTLGGLLVHVADHTQRHVGQAISTAKLVSASKAF